MWTSELEPFSFYHRDWTNPCTNSKHYKMYEMESHSLRSTAEVRHTNCKNNTSWTLRKAFC